MFESNEFWIIACVLASYFAVVGFYAISKQALMIFFGIFNVLLITAGLNITNAFGLEIMIGSAMYAGSFLVTDIIAEKYGKAEAKKFLYIQVATFIIIPIFSLLMLSAAPVSYSQETHDAIEKTFSSSLRIGVALVATVVIAQGFDIWFFHKIKQMSGERFLWLRNNLSTAVSQAIDTVVFWGIAFYGVLPNLLELMLVAYFVKLAGAFLDTPFIYLAKKIIPLDEKREKALA